MNTDTATIHQKTVSGIAVAAVNFEIYAHLVIFSVIIFPICVVIFPTLLSAFSIYIIIHTVSEFVPELSQLNQFVEANWSSFFVICGAGVIALVCFAVLQLLTKAKIVAREGRRLRPIEGKAGARLTEIVVELWSSAKQNSRRVPQVLWFTNFNLMANVSKHGRHDALHISSALWERAASHDKIAIVILAHEIAHLVFHDVPRLHALEAAAAASHTVSRGVLWVILAATSFVSASVLVDYLKYGQSNSEIIFHITSIIIILLLFLIGLFLINTAIRRYSAFIIAIIELRADVYACFLAGGLNEFGNLLIKDHGVRETTLSDIRKSLISPNLTHFSTKERSTLLANPERLASPKLRYFGISVALAVALPLNPITPLFAGGAIDHLLITATIVVLYASAIAMTILNVNELYLSQIIRTELQLSAALTIASMLPQINLYELGYFLTSITAQIAIPGGFGGYPITLDSLFRDASQTAIGLYSQFTSAAGGYWAILSVGVTTLAFMGLSQGARRMHMKTGMSIGFAIIPTLAGVAFVLLSSYHEWRNAFYALDPFALAPAWLQFTKDWLWLRLSAPALAALVVFLFQFAAVIFIKSLTKISRQSTNCLIK